MPARYDSEFLLKFIPDDDHPYYNSLRNYLLSDERVTIPVTLHLGDAKVLSAMVSLYGHARSLFPVALMVVQEEMRRRGMRIEWDAVCFTNVTAKFTRKDVERAEDPFSEAVRRYCRLGFDEAIADARSADIADRPLKITAAILAAGGIAVQSPDFPVIKKPSPGIKLQ